MKLALTIAIIYLIAVGSLVGILASITSGSTAIGAGWGTGTFVAGAGAAGFYHWCSHRWYMDSTDYFY
jgi:hypothetical protein